MFICILLSNAISVQHTIHVHVELQPNGSISELQAWFVRSTMLSSLQDQELNVQTMFLTGLHSGSITDMI